MSDGKFIGLLAEMITHERQFGRDVTRVSMSQGYYDEIKGLITQYLLHDIPTLGIKMLLGVPIEVIEHDIDMWYVVEVSR